jgi:hypothetical protein
VAITVVDDSAANIASFDSDSEPVTTPPVKKRGPKKVADMTPAERAVHDTKVAERKAKKAAKAATAATAATAAVGAAMATCQFN